MKNLRNILAGTMLLGLAGCAERPISRGVIKSESYTPKNCFSCQETYFAVVKLFSGENSGEEVAVIHSIDAGIVILKYNTGDTVNVQQNYGNPRVYQIVDPSVREQR